VWCVILCDVSYLCFIVVPLSPGKNSFAVKINNNNNNNNNNRLVLVTETQFLEIGTKLLYNIRMNF
jgi:hypothetical protein